MKRRFRPLAMKFLNGLALVWVLGIVAIGILTYVPAVSATMWKIRVGGPEYGWMLLLAVTPGLAFLGNSRPKTAVFLSFLLCVLLGWPWMQFLKVHQSFQKDLDRVFPGATLKRSALFLGATEPIEKVTQNYTKELQWTRWRPQKKTPRAKILFLHGGSWSHGFREEYPKLLEYLAGRGFEVVSASYRFAPAHPFPAALTDIGMALDALQKEPGTIFLMGRSAGAHLALLAAYTSPRKVPGVISLYAPTDMVFSWNHPAHPRVHNSREVLGNFLSGGPEQSPQIYKDASPVHRVTAHGPPTLLIHGAKDSIVFPKQADLMKEALQTAKVPHAALTLPWLEHGGDIALNGPTGRMVAWSVEKFLLAHLKD